MMEDILKTNLSLAPQMLNSAIQRVGALDLVGAADLQVILEIFADARQVVDRVDPKSVQALAVADAGPLED